MTRLSSSIFYPTLSPLFFIFFSSNRSVRSGFDITDSPVITNPRIFPQLLIISPPLSSHFLLSSSLLTIPAYLSCSVSVACREGRNDGDNDNGSGRSGAQLMPYILPPIPSYRLQGAERDRGGDKGGNPFEEGPDDEAEASSSEDDEDNSDTEEGHGEYPSSSSSTRRDTSSSSSSCSPLSIAVTDFHYLVLARVRSWGAESRSKVQAGGIGPGPAGRREKERGRGRGGRRSEGKLGYYLLAMSRLDGALSQCIDLTSQAHSSSIVRFKLTTHPHTTQHTPNQPVRPTDLKKKSAGDPPPPAPPLREEGLEGTPLGLFSDPKTGCVWLYSDKALYQVKTIRLRLSTMPDTPLLVRSVLFTC
jgi:hypothetical protein